MNDIEVFQNIKQESKNKLKEILKVKKIPKKQIIFYEREQTDKIYFIKEGKVTLFKINERVYL